MEQRSKGQLAFQQMFGRRDSTSSKGGSSSLGSSSSSSSSKGSSSSSSKGLGKDGFVARLGFKFDVANFDINAVSPTSWWESKQLI